MLRIGRFFEYVLVVQYEGHAVPGRVNVAVDLLRIHMLVTSHVTPRSKSKVPENRLHLQHRQLLLRGTPGSEEKIEDHGITQYFRIWQREYHEIASPSKIQKGQGPHADPPARFVCLLIQQHNQGDTVDVC